MIIFDNHLHLRRDGRYLDAVDDFIKFGGTHFILCQYPNPNLALSNNSYKNIYLDTLKLVNEIENKKNVKVFSTIGPYPIDFLKFLEKLDRKKAIDLMKKGIDEAADFCNENEKFIGIGEIGRPHFKVSEEIIKNSNEILSYAMSVAKDINVPVILHTETTTPKNCKEFVNMGKKVGLKADKIVKHFSPPLILEKENFGLMPSVLASKKNIVKALKKGTRFMMETDYIDDLKRPGAVLGPKTVPKRTLSLLQKGIITEEEAMIIHKKIPEKTYNICLDG